MKSLEERKEIIKSNIKTMFDIVQSEVEPGSMGYNTLSKIEENMNQRIGLIEDYEEVLLDHRKQIKELDVLINGKEGAAEQANLCDIISQLQSSKREEINIVELLNFIAKNEFYTHNNNCFTSRILDSKTFTSTQLINLFKSSVNKL